jgi:hypothetical protein
MSAVTNRDHGPFQTSSPPSDDFHSENNLVLEITLKDRSQQWSAEEKLEVLRDLLRRKYGL